MLEIEKLVRNRENMKNKKGFTLVELLAVIAILALLVIIALPNIMGMFNNAKKSTFISEAKTLVRLAEQGYVKDSFNNTGSKIYVKSPSNNCEKELDGQIRDDLYYYILIDSSGKINKLYIADNSYQFYSTKYDLSKNDIDDVEMISELTDDYKIKIDCDGVSSVSGNSLKVTEFENGKSVNTIFKRLAGLENPRFTDLESNIKSFKRSYSLPDNTVEKKKISSNNSLYPVYAWYKDNTIYYYSEDSTIYLNKDSSNTFAGFQGLESFNISAFNTSNVENMSSLFMDCIGLKTLSLYGIDTKKVTTMENMFYNCSSLTTLDVSMLKTSNVKNMHNMFRQCRNLASLDLANFDTKNVKNMSSMIKDCNNLTSLNLSSFDTSSVTDMSFMFDGCGKMTSFDVSLFNTSNVTDMHSMFDHCFVLVKIYVSDQWNTGNVTNSQHMFRYSPKIVGYKGTKTATAGNPTDKTYARVDNAPDSPGYLTHINNK